VNVVAVVPRLARTDVTTHHTAATAAARRTSLNSGLMAPSVGGDARVHLHPGTAVSGGMVR